MWAGKGDSVLAAASEMCMPLCGHCWTGSRTLYLLEGDWDKVAALTESGSGYHTLENG